MSTNTNTNKENSFAKACVAGSQKLGAQIERVKNNIVAEFRDNFKTHEALLNNALNQADALAWQTGYPQLLFPALAVERIQAAAQWNARQKQLRVSI